MDQRLGAVFFLLASVASVASAQSPGDVQRRAVVSPFSAAKARALMRTRLPCTGCHALGGEGGRIGPDLSTVADRRAADYVRRMIEDPQGTVPGTVMPRVPMPSSMRELIVAYLTRGGAERGAAADSSRIGKSVEGRGVLAAARDGPTIYARYCAVCHGAQGQGNGANARYLPVRPAPHADLRFMSQRSDDRLFDAIYSGGYPLGRSVTMPPFGETLTRSEVWSLVRHLRVLCRCSGPAWSADGRPSHGGRSDTLARAPR